MATKVNDVPWDIVGVDELITIDNISQCIICSDGGGHNPPRCQNLIFIYNPILKEGIYNQGLSNYYGTSEYTYSYPYQVFDIVGNRVDIFNKNFVIIDSGRFNGITGRVNTVEGYLILINGTIGPKTFKFKITD